MKRKQPPDGGKKPSSHRTIKCSLKTILRDPATIEPINDFVVKCNDIVIDTYQFIRLYCLKQYHDKNPIPEIDETFILYCMKALSVGDNCGRKAGNTALQDELAAFYEEEFKGLTTHTKLNRKNMSKLLPYLATQVQTAIHNNLKEHFITRLFRFINKTVVPYEEGLDKQECKSMRNSLKKAILANSAPPELYKAWYDAHRLELLPATWNVNLAYDCKVFPCKYLKHSFFMNEVLEQQGFKLFQPLSLRSSIIPHYITIDTACIVDFLMSKNKAEMYNNIRENQESIWNEFFNLDHRIFRQKDYRFNYTIQTDGVAVSLLFVHDLYDGRKTSNYCNVGGDVDFQYVEDLSASQMADIQGRKIVGGDPGKFSLLYLADNDGNKLRYNAFQRRFETKAKRNAQVIQSEKVKEKVIEKESKLSDKNSKTVDYQKFKEYLKEKNELNESLRKFYLQELFRKLKWRRFVNTQKSEDRFLNNIQKTFGSPDEICIAYGNCSRSTQMKHFMPTKGVGLKKLVARKFMVVMVNEFRTSKLCCHCHKELCHMEVPGDKGAKRLYRCLVCKGCESSESKNNVFYARDLNAALNIRNLAYEWVHHQTRPPVFCRTGGGPPLAWQHAQRKLGQTSISGRCRIVFGHSEKNSKKFSCPIGHVRSVHYVPECFTKVSGAHSIHFETLGNYIYTYSLYSTKQHNASWFHTFLPATNFVVVSSNSSMVLGKPIQAQ